MPIRLGLNRVLWVALRAERVNAAGLRLLSLKRPTFKVGPLLASGNLGGKNFLTQI